MTADGVFVGMFEDFQPESRIAPLSSGDTLLLYTDGITEAEDPTGELFGMDRLKRQLSLGKETNPRLVLDGLLGAMSRFEEGLARQDDLTLVAVRVS